MRRKGIAVRPLVRLMEQAVMDLLAARGIHAERRAGAPGVYVRGAKIAALGLRVTSGCCYHGLALNVDMDLAPFYAIDPCGYPGLAVTQARDLGVADSIDVLGDRLAAILQGLLR
jgi:lipoyl(octanoyl) transferase